MFNYRLLVVAACGALIFPPIAAGGEGDGFSGSAAMEHLAAICELGPRPSGSEAMRRQRAMLAAHFRAAGGTVTGQAFEVLTAGRASRCTSRICSSPGTLTGRNGS